MVARDRSNRPQAIFFSVLLFHLWCYSAFRFDAPHRSIFRRFGRRKLAIPVTLSMRMVSDEADRVNDKSQSTATPANDEMLKSETTSTDLNKGSAILTAPKSAVDTTSAAIPELKVPNRRPPLVSSKLASVYANIYGGLYNPPFEEEEEEEYDEVENTSFYSNIRYTYDDDDDDEDALTDTEFQEVKSDLESKLQGPKESYDDVTGGATDDSNSVPYAYSTDINVVNQRPPLLRNTGILQIQDPTTPEGQGGINVEEEKEVEAEAVALEVAVGGQIPALQIPSSSSFSKAIHIVGKY